MGGIEPFRNLRARYQMRVKAKQNWSSRIDDLLAAKLEYQRIASGICLPRGERPPCFPQKRNTRCTGFNCRQNV